MIERVDIDARYSKPGSLYIPRGSNTAKSREQDKKADVRLAIERGASIILTTEPRDAFAPDAPIIQIDNLVDTLKKLAVVKRAEYKNELIGITGSVGKTTTKDMLRQMLCYIGITYATRGNYNEIDGVLMSLAALPHEAQFALIEICSTRLGSIPAKSQFARPTIGMLTNVGHSHGENYPSRYDILRDKMAMFDDLTGQQTAIVGRQVIDYDQSEENLLERKKIGRLITVGTTPQDTVRLTGAEISAVSTRVDMTLDGQDYSVTVPLAGRQHVDAALFSMAAAHALDLDPADAALNVTRLSSGARRGARYRLRPTDSKKTIEVIDDAQNSAPDSSRALPELLTLRNPARKILVFGDMLELGDNAPAMHDALADDIIAAGIDILVTVGPLAARLAETLKGRIKTRAFKTSGGAAKHVKALAQNGDLIALKGSGGLQLERVMREIAPAAQRRKAKDTWLVEHVTERITTRTINISASAKDTLQTAHQAPVGTFGAFLYRMPLKKGFSTSRHTTTVGSNYILALRMNGPSGPFVAVGEASPRSPALTGDNIPLANMFFERSRPLIEAMTLSTASPETALADVRTHMATLEALAESLATDKNRTKPFRACLAGLDIMLLNAAATLHGIGVTELLGRRRPDVGVSATTLSASKDMGGPKLRNTILRHVTRYPACRAKGTDDNAQNIDIIKAVHEVSRDMGEDKIAWVDMNEAYEPDGAAVLIEEIVAAAERGEIGGTVILEQPVPKRYYDEMCALQAKARELTAKLPLNLLLLADESMWDMSDLLRLQQGGGTGAINIKVQKCGGLLKAMDIAQVAHDFSGDTQIYIGGMLGTSDVTSRALLGLAAALPRFDFITSGPKSNIEAHVVTNPMKWKDKSNVPPVGDGPGLGVNMDWQVVMDYASPDCREPLVTFLAAADIAVSPASAKTPT